MSLTGIFTIGYEGADLADFLASLRAKGVTSVLDIRERAISRRKGFAKNGLRTALSSVGIGYEHEPRLGSPANIRDALRANKDYDQFFADFERHLDDHEALLDELAKTLSGVVALLCYERKHQECHRSRVALRLQKRTGLKPNHMGVRHGIATAVQD